MAAAAMLFSSCQKEVEETPAGTPGGATFKASFEQSEAKVYLGDDFYYRWEAGDLVSVFTGDYSHRQYKAVSGDVVESDLEYVSTTTSSSESLSDFNYAVFPYNAANTLKDGVIYSTIAADQTYRKNDLNNAIMVSQIPASSTSFVFRNSCALLKINIKIAEDFANLHSVKSITVTSSAHKLSGPATVAAASGDYTAKIDAYAETASNSVTLTGCETAGLLQADEYLTFYIVIPAGTYEADDLTISILTSTTSAPFNVTAKVPAAYTAARSQYIDLSTTLAKDYNWFEQSENKVTINENVVLVDKAIMCDSDNLSRQNFQGHDNYDKVFAIPDSDFSLTGKQLVDNGIATDGPNGPTITFAKTNENVFIVNTFTTNNSGLLSLKHEDVSTITVSNLTITGELQTTTMGIYVNSGWIGPNGEAKYYDQSKFHTVWNTVNVTDCRIIPFNTIDKKLGAAVCVFGIAELNNCELTGTSKSDYVDSHYPEYSEYPYYDLAATNSSHTYINGGEVGSIFGWEQAKFTIGGGAKIGEFTTLGISSSSYGTVVINDATIQTLNMNPYYGRYNPMLTLSASAKVGTLTFNDSSGTTLYDGNYWQNVKILEGATVDKVIVGTEEFNLADFISKYNIATM